MEKELLTFIAKAHKNTYAASKEIKEKYKCDPILEGHDDYEYSEGEWSYHDSYAGNAWAPGREVVFYKGKPFWSMAYQGQTIEGLDKDFINEIFDFLKKVLRDIDESFPFRGPKNFKEGDFEYSFEIEGEYRYFIGRENIKYKNKEVFFQNVMCSLIK
jgi:hypothetical protein